MAIQMIRTDVEQAARRLRRGNCCGLLEYSGLTLITSPEKAMAIRRAGYAVGNSGYVVATVTPQVAASAEHLEAAGFTKISKFVNPRTHNTVVVYGAATIKSGGGVRPTERLAEMYGRIR